MSVTIYRDVAFGDMIARYYLDEATQNVELQLLPAGKESLPWEEKPHDIDPLVQVKLAGDTYSGGYAGGVTLRQSQTARELKLKDQQVIQSADCCEVVTTMQAGAGCLAEHHLLWYTGEKTLRSWVRFTNSGDEPVTLELLSSFSLGGLTPYVPGDAHDTMLVHRVRSVWCMEGRLQTDSIEDLQLEPCWTAVRCERFGQVGSMPVNKWFPWLMIEDRKNGVFWGAQIAHNASWQMEIYRAGDALAISGGLADADFGHWSKDLQPGEQLTTPQAILTVCTARDVDEASQRLTSGQIRAINAGPASEQELPVMFNEYCTTWGCPSQQNIEGILKAIKGKGFSYFVIDCGWFKEDGIPWDISMGDYEVSPTLFPDGLGHTIEAIRQNGMVPGIWFEIDNIGKAARAYHNTDHLLRRGGKTLTTTNRRFWDMADPWVQDYLSEKVIGLLKRYNIGYIKMDYNDTIGTGCDGCESLGEGLRRNMDAAFGFIEKMKAEIPGLIIEDCASGGHKLEPKMLGISAMASFSDAHENPELPIIAANLHRVMQPRQSQIWCVIRQKDTLKRIVYSVAGTMLGRMCLSGDVTDLSAEQWKAIDDGVAFYKKAAPIIRDGQTYWFGNTGASYRHPTGWQGILRCGEDGRALCVFHRFQEAETEQMLVQLPDSGYQIEEIYTVNGTVSLDGNQLNWNCSDEMAACAVLLRKEQA